MERNVLLGNTPAITTDLHTHLTGAPRSEELLRIGLAHDVRYPAAMLRLAGLPIPDDIRLQDTDTETRPGGIAAPAPGSPTVRLRDLPAASLRQLAAAMELPLRPGDAAPADPFVLLERAYSVRRPLGAHPALLDDILRSVAADMCRDGVTHLELSASAPLLDPPQGGPAWMRLAQDSATAIFRETGVRMLFLAMINRHASPAAMARSLVRLEEAMALFPALVGLDIGGHETNPSEAFMVAVTEWAASRVHRGMPAVVRVHAGETPYHPGNVRAVLEGFRAAGLPPGMGRVGHALYGVGRREVALARATGAVVEMGLASNRALGYRSGPGRSGGGARLARLTRAGVATVLGTDGHGIYGTSPACEARRAVWDGAPLSVMAEIAGHEREHVRRMRAAFPLPPGT